MQSKLLAETQRLWKERPRAKTIMIVSIETDIPFHWLVHFSKGRTKNPPVCNIETLYSYLSGREIQL